MTDPHASGRTRLTRLALQLALPTASFGWAVSFGSLQDPPPPQDEAQRLAVIFDFDKDSCYPDRAMLPNGDMNGGLAPRGNIVGGCRDRAQLEQANTYYRTASIQKDGHTYAVHMYALYFEKDQLVNWVGGGHRHDWECALVWTTDGTLTHASTSAHGILTTKPVGELSFDADQPEHVKVVYHKHGALTHAFRFAKPGEPPENELGRWVTPTLVDWQTMSLPTLTNEQMRERFNTHDFGAGNCSFNDLNFPNNIAKSPPPDYPSADEWRAATGS